MIENIPMICARDLNDGVMPCADGTAMLLQNHIIRRDSIGPSGDFEVPYTI